MPNSGTVQRQALRQAKRIVIKLGTRVLVNDDASPDLARIKQFATQISQLQQQKHQVIVVSSGAIAVGRHQLGLTQRPRSLAGLQMAASVGQAGLLQHYLHYFGQENQAIGQVLLTHSDLKQRERHLNARNTLLELMTHGIVPIINENDAVSCQEIQVGDNDMLSAMVATLVHADLLVLLTTPNGVQANGKRISHIEKITALTLSAVNDKACSLSTGGMTTKLKSADLANRAGIPCIIASGNTPKVLTRLMQGDDLGTLIESQQCQLNQRKQWLAMFHKTAGELIVDQGAMRAIKQKGKSLLPVGIRQVHGTFSAGAMVNLVSLRGKVFAKGLVNYSSKVIEQIKGYQSTDVSAILKTDHHQTVIHRDNLVMEES